MTFKELVKINVPRSILILCLYILYAVAGSMGEYLFKESLNNILKGNLNGYLFWTFIQAGMEIGTAVLLPIATIAFTRQTQDYVHKIREEIIEHYYASSEDEKTSKMQNQLTANLKLLTTNYATPWVSILSGTLEILIAVVLLFTMNWSLILVSAILLGINFLLPKIMEKKTAQATKNVNDKNEKLLNTIEHWFGGLQELRRFSAYERLRRQLHKASDDYTKANKKNYRYQTTSYLFNGFGNALAQIGISFFAGILFLNHVISFGEFTIKPGEKVLLTGDSGTGKSTLFKALLGKIETKCGKITYFDKESQPITNASLGYLPQDPIVFPISIKDNITMFVKRTEKQLMNVVKNVELKSDLDKMPSGIDTVVNLKKNNLSGGQRQKIVLARSEIYNQPFVLMDEVTSAIDQKATEEIITALLKTDQTILMIAHNFTPELRAKFDQEIKLAKKGEEE